MSSNIDNIHIRVRSTTYRQPRPTHQQFQAAAAAAMPPANQIFDGTTMMGDTAANGGLSSSLIATDPEVIFLLPPMDDDARSRRKDFVLRSHREWEISNVPTVSETGTNPERMYDLQVAGQNHVEGGWPRDCDPTDPEHRIRHLRRTRKEANFLSTVKELVNRSIPVLRSNNSIDIYHSMFCDLIDGKLGEGMFSGLKFGNNDSDNNNNNNNNNNNRDSRRGDDLYGGDGDAEDFDGDDDDALLDGDDDDMYGSDDHDDAADDGDGSPSPGGGGRKRRGAAAARRREEEKEREAKRLKSLSEDLQMACLAGRTVGVNATGVFRDAPRAFPSEILGSEVRDLVRSEQKRIMEQRSHEIVGGDMGSAVFSTVGGGGGGGSLPNFGSGDFSASQTGVFNKADAARRRPSTGTALNTADLLSSPTGASGVAGGSMTSPSPAAAGSGSGSLRESVMRSLTTSNNRQVVLGPCATFSAAKVVSSLSWVSNLNIPGASPPGGATTLAIALASVSNTPHLALLGSSAQSEVKSALNARRGSTVGAAAGDHYNVNNTTTTSSNMTGSGSGGFSNAQDIATAGVDMFPTSLIYDAASPQAPLLRLKTASDLLQLEFSPRDLPLLASGSSDGTINLFDLRRGPTRCLLVADIANAGASVLSSGGGGAASSSSAQQHHHASSGGGGTSLHDTRKMILNSAAAASARRNPLNPVCSVRWMPSGTGARCTEFITADLSPFVRIWDTRFASRGCLDMFNLSSGAVLAAVVDAGLEIGGPTSAGGGRAAFVSTHGDDDGGIDDDDDVHLPHHRAAGGGGGGSRSTTTTSALQHMLQHSAHLIHRAVSIDVQAVSGRVFIGTTDGKVFAFNRKGRTDQDRLCGVFQVVPRESVFCHADVYVHVAAHPTLPKCFAVATEWSVQVYCDDIPRPVAQLPPSAHGIATSIKWVPHCASLLSISRVSGVVEIWDLCVMLTSLADGGIPKASTLIMEYAGHAGGGGGGGGGSSGLSSSLKKGGGKGKSATIGGVTDAADEAVGGSSYGSSSSSSPSVLATMKGPPISTIRFSPDGSHLVAGLLDGSATLLDVTIQDDASLVDAAERAAAAAGPKGAAPVTGARALEHVCFGRIVEKRGAHRTKRLLKLHQQNAPDVTTASSTTYQSAEKANFGSATMVNDHMTMDMARLSQLFNQAVAQETSAVATTTTSVIAGGGAAATTAAGAGLAAAWVPPFRSTDAKTSRVMERVGNLLFNPSCSSSTQQQHQQHADSPLQQQHQRKQPLSAPLACDATAVAQLSRAVETGVPVAPERSAGSRRWSTVRRNLLPTAPPTAAAPAAQQHHGKPAAAANVTNLASTARVGGKENTTTSNNSSGTFSATQPPPLSATSSGGGGSFRRPRSVAVRVQVDDDDE